MSRPVTLFTGQWADMPIEELAAKAGGWGFDGLELACWGDHFDVAEALRDPAYASRRRELLERNGLRCWALGAHLVGQAVCDPIDARHQSILPPEVWGDGDPEGVRQRAAARLGDTARAAALLGVTQVNGFSGSPVWHQLYSFPPNDFDAVEAAYGEFAERFGPILDVFDAEGVRFGLEVHPTEIAYDFVTTRKALDAVGRRAAFGINMDPSHFAHQFLDPAAFVDEFADRIYHVHVKDSRMALDGRRSILGSHLDFGVPGPRLGLRLAGPRRRRLRGVHPGAQPRRLRRPAVDRVGGRGHGPRARRPGGAGVHPPAGLHAVVGRVRRGVRGARRAQTRTLNSTRSSRTASSSPVSGSSSSSTSSSLPVSAVSHSASSSSADGSLSKKPSAWSCFSNSA